MKKKLIFVLTLLISILIGVNSAYALYYPDSYYNNISWTWEYNAPYTTSYNCLGYATGSMVWEWPWGSNNPTASQVDSYLGQKGYTGYWWGYPIQPKIISYGSSTAVTHFSKVPTGVSDYCIAKWGSLERFKHYSWDPYYSDSDYGPPVKTYQ